MKRNLLSFAALAAAVLFSGSVLAKTEKASVSLEFQGRTDKQYVNAAAYDDYSFELSVPQSEVDFTQINVQINGTTQKVVTISIPDALKWVDLSMQLGNMYTFGTATLNVNLKAGENQSSFVYNMGTNAAGAIVATPTGASEAFAAIKECLGAAGAQGGNLLIKAGSVISYGGKRLEFTQDFAGTKDIDQLMLNLNDATVESDNPSDEFMLVLKPGSKLAMGNSGRAFLYETTITVTGYGTLNGAKLAAMKTTSISDFVNNTLLFVNDLVGALNGQTVTVDVVIDDPWVSIRGAKSTYLGDGKDHALQNGEFGTFVLEEEITEFRGAEVYSINEYDAAAGLLDLIEEHAPLNPGQPYIFRATSAKLQGIIDATVTVEIGDYNGLVGASDLNFQLSEDQSYYVVPNDGSYAVIKNNVVYKAGNNVGLYPHTAAIKLGDAPVAGAGAPQHVGKHLRVAVAQDATEGIEDAQAEVAATKMIVNGQLVIVKNGVMYNAAGMQVK